MGVLEAIAALARYIPSVEKPARRPSLPARLAWTGLIVTLYLVMTEIPLYGTLKPGIEAAGTYSVTLYNLLFGTAIGSLMTLGIGPMVTAGIVLQVLVGGGFLKLDLTKPSDRKLFMDAQRTLTILFAVFEASAYAAGCAFWRVLGAGVGGCPATMLDRVLVVIQLLIATLIIMWFDELTQKGWGIGSALSLIIVAGVAKGMFWQLAGTTPIEGGYYGWLAHFIMTGDPAILRLRYPDLVGLIATIATIVVLVYLQLMKVYIPVTSPRYGGVRSRIPLNFIYVTNIPILFVGILVNDLRLLYAMVAGTLGASHPVSIGFEMLYHYTSPPHGLLDAISDPLRLLTFTISWLALSLVFGFIWVEVAGLSPQKQAENLIKSGLEVPGIRRNPRILESILAKYIYPLTIISSLVVGAVAIIASIFGAYGSGSGLILLVGILYNFYTILSYERTLEMYPLLRRIVEGA